MPTPIDPKYISPSEAQKAAYDMGVHATLPTINRWIDDYKLGFQPSGPGGKIYVDRHKWEDFLNGRLAQQNSQSA